MGVLRRHDLVVAVDMSDVSACAINIRFHFACRIHQRKMALLDPLFGLVSHDVLIRRHVVFLTAGEGWLVHNCKLVFDVCVHRSHICQVLLR